MMGLIKFKSIQTLNLLLLIKTFCLSIEKIISRHLGCVRIETEKTDVLSGFNDFWNRNKTPIILIIIRMNIITHEKKHKVTLQIGD